MSGAAPSSYTRSLLAMSTKHMQPFVLWLRWLILVLFLLLGNRLLGYDIHKIKCKLKPVVYGDKAVSDIKRDHLSKSSVHHPDNYRNVVIQR